jgi:hypothetical protein
VIARGEVIAVDPEGEHQRIQCRIWLEHDERGILLEGEATVVM